MAADEESDMDIEEIINALREEEGNEGGENMDSNMKNTDTRDIEEEVDLQELLKEFPEQLRPQLLINPLKGAKVTKEMLH